MYLEVLKNESNIIFMVNFKSSNFTLAPTFFLKITRKRDYIFYNLICNFDQNKKTHTIIFPLFSPASCLGQHCSCVYYYINFQLYLLHKTTFIYMVKYNSPLSLHPQSMSRPIPPLLWENKVAPALEENEGNKNLTSTHLRLIMRLPIQSS